jgi:hypothetical protein
MIDIQPRLLIILLAYVSASVCAGAAEPNAVGIVMKVTGETTPNLAAREEIPANTAIKLYPGVELTFLHYPPNCELVTVTGGTVKLSKTAFTTDGNIKNQQGRACPRLYELSGTAGGWVARDLLRLPVDPEIIFAGSRGDQVAAAAVYDKDQPDQLLFRFELADRRATQPAAAAPLNRDRRYVLKVTMRDNPQSIDYPFIIVSSGQGDSLVVLHVD